MTGGPGLSSGTGAGTGAGGRTGVLRNQSGSMSGVGPGASGNVLRGRPVPPLPGSESRRGMTSFGPGRRRDVPQRPLLDPVHGDGRARRRRATARCPTASPPDLLKNARLIATPEERSLALQRIANGAIGSQPTESGPSNARGSHRRHVGRDDSPGARPAADRDRDFAEFSDRSPAARR